MEIKETREVEIEQGQVRVFIRRADITVRKGFAGLAYRFDISDLDDLIACLQEAKKQITKGE